MKATFEELNNALEALSDEEFERIENNDDLADEFFSRYGWTCEEFDQYMYIIINEIDDI